MNKQAVNAADFEKKILSLVKNRNYKNFIKTPAAVGATVGGVGGGALGAVSGIDDPNSKGILHNALTGGLEGAAVGGSLGAAKGLAMKREFIKKQLGEVEGKLGIPGYFKKIKDSYMAGRHLSPAAAASAETARADQAKRVFEEMASSGKFNDVNVVDHLNNSDRLLDKGLSGILSGVGIKPKSPEEMLAARNSLTERLQKYIETGNTLHMDTAGLSNAEKELLSSRLAKGRPDAEKTIEDLADVRYFKPKEIPSAAAVPPAPSIADFSTLQRKAEEEMHREIQNATANPHMAHTHLAKSRDAFNRMAAFSKINKLKEKYEAALMAGGGQVAKNIYDDLLKAISAANMHIPTP
jgi:hypothetical protein